MTAHDLIGKTIADKFRIDSHFRGSEFADYFRATDIFRGETVILKLIKEGMAAYPELIEAFQQEAKLLSLNEVTNLIHSSGSGTAGDGSRYFVLEYLKGHFLDDLIKDERKLDVQRAVNIAAQAASGAHVALLSGQMERAIAPENIFVDSQGGTETVKLFDIGKDLSIEVSTRQNAVIVPKHRLLKYVAPENVPNADAPDEIATVHSLAVILYEILAGEPPIQDGLTVAETYQQKLDGDPPSPMSAFRNDLPARLETAIIRAMSKDREARQQTLAEFESDIRSAVAAAAAAPRRSIWQTVLMVLAGIALLAFALIYATSVRKTDPTVALQAEPGSLPVQPIGPATGAMEESLAKMPAMTEAEIMAAGDANTAITPGALPGGDGINPWANGGTPPPGAPQYVPPGGQVYTIDPNGGSQFMPPDGVVLVPVPANSNTAVKPPKNANSNTAVQPTPTPKPMATPTTKVDKPAVPAAKPTKTPVKPGDPE